ncbi:hypothetical protein STSP2_01103 [Anaerohalosphaera lusitana]|uniref:Uncharacterized protein n=1 Tax=Anaerohalosphaera lusitana TaxID=1936003 RepID=A0A1U9NJ56_9BACT|nr:hypothetical protein [Anaerohalosphaera lusitana]AQT67951.1 hypothetical protein STSP2_01103 [Anaerohalosphaera lusitana]
MDISNVMEMIWRFCNSSFGFAAVWAATVGFFLWLGSRYNPFELKWKKYEGSIITAIRLAEKQIPDDTDNAGMRKLDWALRFVLQAYAKANGSQPSQTTIEQLKEGIQIKHNELAVAGALDK